MPECRHFRARHLLSVLLSVVMLPWELPAQSRSPEPSHSAGLKIYVLQGEKAANFIPDHTGLTAVVEVRDVNELPVAGATVEFRLPETGPGGEFANGTHVLSATTNLAGQAEAPFTVRPEPGLFQIQVSAKLDTRSASVVMSQLNTLKQTDQIHSTRHWYKNWKVWAVVGGAATVAVVVVLLTRGGGSNAKTIGITPGSPTFGAPH
jgi:hypothetical protein